MELSGAQILLESLRKEGVDVVFGFPGGAVIDIYDHLPDYPIKHVLVRHEQGAIHAADGYARASGKVGVCLVTSGPGATNTVTGIATAYMDSIPVVIFTGQVPTPLIGNDAFQEVDIVGITRSCTKHNYLVKDVASLAYTIKEAFYLASSGRPGPVLVDIPKDVQQAVTEYRYPKTIKMRSYNPTFEPNIKQVRKVADLIAKAKKPVIYAGGGVISANAHEELTWLARTFKIPVTATLMALGCFPGDDPLWLGMLGMHGTFAANHAINNADSFWPSVRASTTGSRARSASSPRRPPSCISTSTPRPSRKTSWCTCRSSPIAGPSFWRSTGNWRPGWRRARPRPRTTSGLPRSPGGPPSIP
jgi:acetolactate synthase-1/2/3 large subunit